MSGQTDFYLELFQRQISAREFFNASLLESISRNIGLNQVIILYFDTQGNFLSWVDASGVTLASASHPYVPFVRNDVVRHLIFQEAVRDQLTYFNVKPRIYLSSEVIVSENYENSSYVRFLEKTFHAKYSATLAFGLNAYIQMTFFKSEEQGDFTEQEREMLEKLYITISNSYKNFKKHEQAKIVAKIQEEIISTGEQAYFITDRFLRVLSYNQKAKQCMGELVGEILLDQMDEECPCTWMSLIFGQDMSLYTTEHIIKTPIKNWEFRIHTFDQSYSNGIIDRYHWVIIHPRGSEDFTPPKHCDMSRLTATEQKVAQLIYQGLTYKEIAAHMVISYHTVKKHVQNIYAKCGVQSQFHLRQWMEGKESNPSE